MVLTNGSRKPSAKRVPLQLRAAVPDPDFEVLQRLVPTATSGCDPDDLDGVGSQEVHGPPGTDLLLGFGASLAVVVRALLAVVGIYRTSASHRGRLVGRFSEGYVST